MKKIFTISILSLTALVTAQSTLAKKFIYDDQTGLYTEIRDNQNYDNGGQYYGQKPSYNPAPQYDNSRYYYDCNRDQRVDKMMPRPSWDWKVGDKIPEQFRSKQYQVKSSDSPRIYDIDVDEQWYRINSDYVLADDRYRIIRIIN